MLRKKIAPHVVDIIDQLQSAGHETYIVGGAVRDLLLDREPKDYDLSSSATPEEIRRVFGRHRARIIGRRFRLIHLYHGREIIEISTFRRAPEDSSESISRHHEKLENGIIRRDNEYGTAREDAWRRDFTVNAIFYDPIARELLDFTELGIPDLEKRLVRTLGEPELRFNEDPVRILRALKLVGQYGFTPVPETESALFSCLPLIDLASKSRLSLELEKILHKPWSDDIFRAFHRFGFLAHYLPFLNYNWNSPAADYMLRLLALRNKRLLAGEYHRNSLSLALATAVLPFVEAALSRSPGELWENHQGIDREIRKIIFMVFQPCTFPKRVTAAAQSILLTQAKFHEGSQPQRLLRHPRYWQGRELFLLQNELVWRDPELAKAWPARGEESERKNNPRRRPRRKPRSKN